MSVSTGFSSMAICLCNTADLEPTVTATVTKALYGAAAAVASFWIVTSVAKWMRLPAGERSFVPRCRWFRGALAENPKAREIFLRRRAERFAQFVAAGCKYVVPIGVSLVFFGVWSQSRQRYDPDIVSNAMILSAALFTCLMLLVLDTFKLPQLFHQASCAALYLLGALYPPFGSTVMAYRFLMTGSILVQMLLSQQYPDRRMAYILNIATLIWRLACLASITALRGPYLTGNLTIILGAFACNLSVSIGAVTTMEAESLALNGEREAQSSSKCLESLLAVMSDAVVVLKADLSLWEPSQALVSLLLRSPGLRQGLEEQKFANFLAPDDVERFENFVLSNSQEVPMARSLRVDLMDSLGARVPVRVYHTCLRDPWDQSEKHLLGLVEDAEPERNSARELLAMKDLSSNNDNVPRAESVASSANSHVSGIQFWRTVGAATEASVVLRTTLKVEVVSQCETSSLNFGFDEGPKEDWMNRFRNAPRMQRWFEFLHVLGTSGVAAHPGLKFGKVGFVNTTTGVGYMAKTRAEIKRCARAVRPTDEEEAGEWEDLEECTRSVEVELFLRPLTPGRRERRPRREVRDGPLVRVASKRML